MIGRLAVRQFSHSQWLSVPPQKAFQFFECPENLASVTPPQLDFDLLSPSPVAMREGAVIDYTIRRFGLRLRWRTLITQYQPPESFVDEQLLGPYSLWRHEHRFVAEGSGTRMYDQVHYALPNAIPGVLADWLDKHYVRLQLKHIFEYREQRFAELIGTE